MKIAEVLLLLSDKEKEMYTLINERKVASTISYKKDEGVTSVERPERSVDELTTMIEKLSKDIRKLRLEVSKANVNTVVEWQVDGERITLGEAINLIKQMRNTLPAVNALSQLKTNTRFVDPNPYYNRNSANAVDRSYEEITEPTFDTKIYKAKAEKLTREIRALESVIQTVNWAVDISWAE